MNEQLQAFARNTLKAGLAQLPETWQNTFRLMYARKNGKRSVDEALAIPINQVVDEMPAYSLDWAMQQVNNSLCKHINADIKKLGETA